MASLTSLSRHELFKVCQENFTHGITGLIDEVSNGLPRERLHHTAA